LFLVNPLDDAVLHADMDADEGEGMGTLQEKVAGKAISNGKTIQRATAMPEPATIRVDKLIRRRICRARTKTTTSAKTPALHRRPIDVPERPSPCQYIAEKAKSMAWLALTIAAPTSINCTSF